MLAMGKFPVWDAYEIPLLELYMYLVIVSPSTCQGLPGCHCSPDSEVVSTKLCLYPSPSTTLLFYTLFQGLLIYIDERPRSLLHSPRKWEMHELHSDFLFLQVLLTNTGPSLAELIWWFLVPFLSALCFSNLNQFPVHPAGDKGVDLKLALKEVTGWNFTSGGISPDFPKLYKSSVQCELKLCWFFNFCIFRGDSNGQSKQSCNQCFFCSHPVPQVMTFHAKSSQSVCPDRLYYLYLCNTL